MAHSSDSENFESADEDFIDSDNETIKKASPPVVATAKVPPKTEIKLEITPKVIKSSEQVSSNTELEPGTIKVVNADEQFSDVSTKNDVEATISIKLAELKTDPEILEIPKVKDVVQDRYDQEETEKKPIIAPNVTKNAAATTTEGDTLAGDQQNTQKQESVKDEISKFNTDKVVDAKKAEDVISKKKSQENLVISSREEPVPSVSSIPITTTVTQNKNENIINEPKLTESDPDADGDGWEFDEWGDEDQATASSTAIKPVVEEQDVGWDVWDDEDDVVNAGNQSSIPTANKSSSSDQFFPVLADISPKKEAKTEGGLLGNISKFLISDENPSTFPLQKRKESSEGIPPGTNASNWGWKPWGGVASLLSTATEGMATITSNVSSLIESGIGAPDPMELARHQREVQLKREAAAAAAAANVSLNRVPSDERLSDTEHNTATVNCDSEQQEKKADEKSLYLGSFVSGVTQIGNRVIAGGLDTLEGIGKKTMTILQENDPGLLNKRKLLMMDKDAPALSQILREAKEKTEEAEKNLKIMHKQQYKKQLHFETLFDDYHGLVHLEALEMLSRQSTIKLQSLLAPLSGRALDDLQETLDEVKELCELSELDADDCDGTHTAEELSEKLGTAIEDLDVQMNFTEMLQCWRDSRDWLQSDASSDPQVIHDRALRCLAQTTAFAVQRLHKLAELLLIKERHSTADEADSLVQLTNTVCWHLSGIAGRFGGALSELKNEDEANSLITSTFMEGSNSILYIQNAFRLFIPILQVGAA